MDNPLIRKSYHQYHETFKFPPILNKAKMERRKTTCIVKLEIKEKPIYAKLKNKGDTHNERNLQARCKRLVPYNSLLSLYTPKYIERDNQSHSHTVYLCKYSDLHGLATKYYFRRHIYLICMDLSLWVLNKKKGLIKKRGKMIFYYSAVGAIFLRCFTYRSPSACDIQIRVPSAK